ncbi:MAG: hypothetical protein M3Q82_02980 [Actinomycetota bacterium]|nr:hypothetical protein [Actinomycetota bacterium]
MADSETPSAGWMLRALPAVTFLVGVVIGGLFVGVGLDGDDSDSSDSSQTTPPDGSETTSGTAVVIPAACSQAAQAVTEAVGLIRDGAASVRNFQPEKLIEVLDQLEVLDPELQRLAAACAKVEVNPSSPALTEPTPESATPTE